MKVYVIGFGKKLINDIEHYKAACKELKKYYPGEKLIRISDDTEDECGFKASVLETALKYIKKDYASYYAKCTTFSDIQQASNQCFYMELLKRLEDD